MAPPGRSACPHPKRSRDPKGRGSVVFQFPELKFKEGGSSNARWADYIELRAAVNQKCMGISAANSKASQ